jgi:Ca2+-binding EF-hand superfamily protein
VNGLTDVGTHHAPASKCAEPALALHHWELSLDGTIVKGTNWGARIRAVAAIDVEATNSALLAFPAKLVGVVEGVTEQDCTLTEANRRTRVDQALIDAKSLPEGPCDQVFPCLARIAKQGQSSMHLDQIGVDRCEGSSDGAYKTWSHFDIALLGIAAIEGGHPPLGDGILMVTNFVQILEKEGARGEHYGRFTWQANGTIIQGVMLGASQAGTHRTPLKTHCETFDFTNHFEGRLSGEVISGTNRGAIVEARYVIQEAAAKGRQTHMEMNLDGWEITGCIGAPAIVSTNKPSSIETNSTVVLTPAAPIIAAKQVFLLPENLFRPAEALPPAAVAAFRTAEGGKLTDDGTRTLRLADKRFRDLDRNHDGYLDSSEFAATYQLGANESNRSSNSDAGAAFAKSLLSQNDKNKDGFISRDEAGKGWETLQALDADQDGRLSAAELAMGPMLLAEREFKKIDKNADSRIDFSEFVLWYRTLPKTRIGTENH